MALISTAGSFHDKERVIPSFFMRILSPRAAVSDATGEMICTIPRRTRSETLIAGVTLGVCAVVVLVFVGLIPLGQWIDEYFTIAHIRDGGLPYVMFRLRSWSPRPFSELLVYFYARAVDTWNRPLVTPSLALSWLLVAAAILGPALRARRAVLLPAVLGALLLVGHPVAEMFYWPIAAFAYLPTLAAVVLLLTLDWAGMEKRGLVIAALLIAALSSEVGAMFTAAYCVLAGLAAFLARERRAVLPLLLPLLAALVAIYYLSQGRGSAAQEVFGDPAVAHHPAAAFLQALKVLPMQLAGLGATDVWSQAGRSGAVSKLLLFCGIYLTVPVAPADRTLGPQLRRIALGLALLGATFLTLWAAFLQFGMVCCERHGTMRQEFVLVAIGALATALAAWWRPADHRALGAALLLVAVVLPLVATGPLLAADYGRYPRFLAVRAALWRSGTDTGSTMVVPQTEPGLIVGGTLATPGSHPAEEGATDVLASRLVAFFHKAQGTFEAPALH